MRDIPSQTFLLSPKAAAPKLARSKWTLKKWRQTGMGPEYVVLPRGRVAYRPEAIEAWLAGRTNGSPR